MKKTCKKLVSLLLTLVITLSVLTVAPFAVSAADEAAEQVGRVQDSLNTILSVYPTGSYFTASGNVCYSNQSSDCRLSNIPSRGGLPSGSSVAAVTGDAWSCCSFARYVFYCMFGVSPESCGTVSSSNAQIGDYMNLGTHYAIYLGQDSTYWYVYDSNYTETLIKDTDYTVEYSNNINTGTATVTVTGIGNYTGVLTKTFTITNAIGDVDGDGIISVSDATALQKQLANGVEFDDEMLAVADTNGDGIVSVSDATLIQKYLAGNASSLG